MAKISKVIYAGETLIDLTNDTVTKDKLLIGATAHGKDGELIEGTCPYDADTSEANAAQDEIIAGQTAYVRGVMVTGTMPNKGAVSGTISSKSGKYTVPQGYHDGSGTVQIDSTEQAKLIPANIRDGVTILGVEGTMSGTEGVKAQSKTVMPSAEQQTVLPDSGYNYLSQVTVAAIPYVETDNSAGGKTVTIGAASATITFTIRDTSYQAYQGMTWGEWAESAYNTGGYVIGEYDESIGAYVIQPSYDSSLAVSGTTHEWAAHTEAIVAGKAYRVISW